MSHYICLPKTISLLCAFTIGDNDFQTSSNCLQFQRFHFSMATSGQIVVGALSNYCGDLHI